MPTYGRALAPSATSATPRMRNRPRSGRVAAQAVRVGDDDRSAAGLDPAERAHLGERLRHGLARRTAPVRELLLGEGQRDLDALFGFLAEAISELAQTPRDPAQHVVRSEVGALRVGVPEPVDDDLLQRPRHPGGGVDQRAELSPRAHERGDGFERLDARGARPPVDGAEFADEVAWATEAEHGRVPVAAGRADLHPALDQDDHALGVVALVVDDRAARIATPHGDAFERVLLSRSQKGPEAGSCLHEATLLRGAP